MSAKCREDLAELVILAKTGDRLALGRLLASYRSYLLLLARVQIGRHLRGKIDPSDVLQETCLEVQRDIGRFRGSGEREFIGWLRRILAGILANQLRRYLGTQRRDVRLEEALEADLDRSSVAMERAVVADQTTPSERAVRREQSVLLAVALDTLPADYREVIVLRHLEELGFAEVSRRMGRSEDSVKNLWARALVRLRHVLGDSQ
jgi:RNA polymerase sigma-70 factor (ECF subfamily)